MSRIYYNPNYDTTVFRDDFSALFIVSYVEAYRTNGNHATATRTFIDEDEAIAFADSPNDFLF